MVNKPTAHSADALTPPVKEQRIAHLEIPVSPVSQYEGKLARLAHSIEIATEVARSSISFLLSLKLAL